MTLSINATFSDFYQFVPTSNKKWPVKVQIIISSSLRTLSMMRIQGAIYHLLLRPIIFGFSTSAFRWKQRSGIIHTRNYLKRSFRHVTCNVFCPNGRGHGVDYLITGVRVNNCRLIVVPNGLLSLIDHPELASCHHHQVFIDKLRLQIRSIPTDELISKR